LEIPSPSIVSGLFPRLDVEFYGFLESPGWFCDNDLTRMVRLDKKDSWFLVEEVSFITMRDKSIVMIELR